MYTRMHQSHSFLEHFLFLFSSKLPARRQVIQELAKLTLKLRVFIFLCLLVIEMYNLCCLCLYACELTVSFDSFCFIFILYFNQVVTFLARRSLLVNLLTDHLHPSCKKHKALNTSTRVATQRYSSFTRYNDAAAIIINNINRSYVYLLCLSSFIHG